MLLLTTSVLETRVAANVSLFATGYYNRLFLLLPLRPVYARIGFPRSIDSPRRCITRRAAEQKTQTGRLFMKLLCTFVLFSALVWAQSFQGSLRGRVTDPKDAVVPLAKVTVTEDSTAVSSSTVT